MTKALIIVESPTKIKTLRKFLGSDFIFESSLGHIRDLPTKRFGIDIDHDFAPEYEVLEGKKEVIAKLKKAAKEVDVVYLSPDPDREGEAIAWHIANLLPKGVKYKRVAFNEITKDAVLKSLKNPREINAHLVDAQQARRLLDRMVGYKISPILQRKIARGGSSGALSAGRVQSVALKLVVEREKEIQAFVPVEYWKLGSILHKIGDKKTFEANLYSVDGKKVEKQAISGKEVFLISNEQTALTLKKRLESAKYKVVSVQKREKKRMPPPPFITSTLQQEASRHYGFSSAKTMLLAQNLYEGIDLGTQGSEGLITYMRTDSFRVSPEAEIFARSYIKHTYGKEYLPDEIPKYASKKNSQDAHEAIRPTNLDYLPERIKDHLTVDQYKLYLLIWRRFFASQMNPAIYDTVSSDIETTNGLVLRVAGSVIKFPGFLAVYQEKSDSEEEANEEKEVVLPDFKEGDPLNFVKAFATQSFTIPPPRFTEASLVKELEKSGIGRPSTYATIMGKIQSRAYTTKEKGALKPTELGMLICQMLEENFPQIMDVQFTANMESDLDKIAEDCINWKAFIKSFWDQFYPLVQAAEKEAKIPKIETDLKCPTCGSNLQKIWSRGKYFYGCSKYPDCNYTAPLEELTYNKEDYAPDFDWEQKCPNCGGEMKVRKSRFGIFLGCAKYPECKTIINIPRKGEIAAKDLPPCPAIGCEGKIVQRRSRFGKSFFSCSTFPDCDVIANSLEELSSKYPNHPKTPYEKKGGKKSASKKKEGDDAPSSKKKTTKKAAPAPAKKAATRGKKKAPAPAKKASKKTATKAPSKRKKPS